MPGTFEAKSFPRWTLQQLWVLSSASKMHHNRIYWDCETMVSWAFFFSPVWPFPAQRLHFYVLDGKKTLSPVSPTTRQPQSRTNPNERKYHNHPRWNTTWGVVDAFCNYRLGPQGQPLTFWQATRFNASVFCYKLAGQARYLLQNGYICFS